MPDFIGRRSFVAITAIGLGRSSMLTHVLRAQEPTMYGLIGKMSATAGQRDALIAILLAGTSSMPGCRSYIVAKDTTDPDGLWITEVWASKELHDTSLKLPAVQQAIAKGRPLIAGFSRQTVTTPVGGYGMAAN